VRCFAALIRSVDCDQLHETYRPAVELRDDFQQIRRQMTHLPIVAGVSFYFLCSSNNPSHFFIKYDFGLRAANDPTAFLQANSSSIITPKKVRAFTFHDGHFIGCDAVRRKIYVAIEKFSPRL
jgi:hypothetical protein